MLTVAELSVILFTIFVIYCLKCYLSPAKIEKCDRAKQHAAPPKEEPKRNDMPEIVKSGGLVEYIRKQHASKGPVIELYAGENNKIVSISDADLIKQVVRLGSRPAHLFDFIVPLFGKDNLTVYTGERAAKHRKIMANAFGPQVISQKYETLINIGIESIIDKWSKHCDENRPVYIQEDLLNFSLNTIIFAALSTNVDKLGDRSFKKDYDDSLNSLYSRQFGYAIELDDNGIERAINNIKSTLKSIINERKETFERATGSKADDLFDILLSSIDPDTGKPFEEEKILSHVSLFLIAGYHTTAIGLVWLIFSLTQHPEVYAKVQHELDEHIVTSQPTQKELDELKYLDQVMKEALRVHTPGSFVTREVDVDFLHIVSADNVKYTFERGTNLFFPLSILHMNPKYFTNPEEFRPERFTSDAGDSLYPYSYLPFGFGIRSCPGERINRVETKMMIAMIMRQFDFELDMNPKEVVPEEKFVVMAKNDVRVKLRKRNCDYVIR